MTAADVDAEPSPVALAALEVFRHDRTPIALLPGMKRPARDQWQRAAYADESAVLAEFGGYADAGLGVRLGGGLADVDLDSPTALRAAPYLLVDTRMRSGRASSPESHWWYEIPDGQSGYLKIVGPSSESVVELRATPGHQTAIPPTVHPSGEPYEWFGERWKPEPEPLDKLTAAVCSVGVAAILADAWPSGGTRNDAYLALSGALLRGCADHAEAVRAAGRIVSAIARLAGDEEARVRSRETVPSTVRKLKAGDEPVTGWTRLGELLDPRPGVSSAAVIKAAQKAADKLREALGAPADDREAAGAELGHAARVRLRADELRVTRDARALLAAEGAPEVPEPVSLAAWLAMPDEPIRYLVDGLWPAGENVLWTGPNKAGKTTGRDNLLRSLVDGSDFLGRFAVAGTVSSAALVDFELSENVMRPWLRRTGIRNTGRVDLYPMRGRAAAFNLLVPEVRAVWAERLRGRSVLLVDCLRPICDALGLDESHDLSRLLGALDELAAEAGIGQWIAFHHTGWEGERARGDSGAEGTAGVIWRTVREDPARMDSPRYFSAYGRGVEVAESLLSYDDATRSLTIAGGSRAERRRDADAEALVCALAADRLRRVAEGEQDGAGAPLTWTQNTIERQIAELAGLGQKAARTAAQRATSAGLLVTSTGERRSRPYALTPEGLALADEQAANARKPAAVDTSPTGGEVASDE